MDDEFRLNVSNQECYFHCSSKQDRDDWYDILHGYCYDQILDITNTAEGYDGMEHEEKEKEDVVVGDKLDIAPIAFAADQKYEIYNDENLLYT